MFASAFLTVFTAIVQLFLIAAAAGVMVRKKAVTRSQVESLSTVTVNIFLPCLIVSKTVARFDPAAFPLWWILPLSGALLVLAGLGASWVLFRGRSEKLPLLPLASMQNAVYIVLPVGRILYPDRFDLFVLYCFLLVMGLTPVMWSLGKVLISGKRGGTIQWRDFVTPPFTATLVSVFLVFAGISEYLPAPLVSAMDLLGQATVPLAVFILGAMLGTISLADMPAVPDIVIVSCVKFILVPAAAFIVLYTTGLYLTMPFFCSLIILQASAPPATNLILMVKNYGGDSRSISSMMLLMYLLCIPVMPLWLALWQLATG
ncbi:MAG: AEC family transporter [Desulfobacteraceae bacterium]